MVLRGSTVVLSLLGATTTQCLMWKYIHFTRMRQAWHRLRPVLSESFFTDILTCKRWIDQQDASVGQRKTSESPTRIEPMTSRTPGGPFIHWVTRTQWIAQWTERPPGFREVMGSIPVGDSDVLLCPTLASCSSIHFSHFITELKIHHLYYLR